MKILLTGYEASDARLKEAQTVVPDALVDHRPGPFDEAEQADFWKGLALAAPPIVWVRWMALEPPNIPALRRFRVARPETRIIVEIPDDLTPPDPALGELVSMGVYDILRASHTLGDALAGHHSYADVVRWQGNELPWDDDADKSQAPQRQIVEKVVERRVPLTNRPVLIAVWGSIPGAGASTAALAVGCRLAAHGPAACLDHPRDEEKGHDSLGYMTGLHFLAQHYMAKLPKRVEIFPTAWPEDAQRWPSSQPVPPAPEWPTVFRSREFAYLVIDAGVYTTGMSGDGGWQATLWENADLNVMLLPPAISRLTRAHHWLAVAGEGIPGLAVGVLQDGGRLDLADVYRSLAGKDVAIWRLGWPDFTGRNNIWESSFDALLQPILPDAPVRRSRWRLFH